MIELLGPQTLATVLIGTAKNTPVAIIHAEKGAAAVRKVVP